MHEIALFDLENFSYIMTSQNEEAEELMRRIEKEEETLGKLIYNRSKITVFF